VSATRLEIADVFRQHEKEFFAKWGSQLTAQERKVSGISARVAPPPAERALNNVISVLSERWVSTPAAIATVRAVSPVRETAGWQRWRGIFFPCRIAMLSSRCRDN
jgi:hypothetical protein